MSPRQADHPDRCGYWHTRTARSSPARSHSSVSSSAASASDPGFEVSVAAPEPNRRLHDALLEATGTSAAIHVPAQQLPLAALFLHDPRRTRAVRKALSGLDVDVILSTCPAPNTAPRP